MTRKTNFFHGHRDAATRPRRPAALDQIGLSSPVAAPPAAPVAAPAPRPWWTRLSAPRWPGRSAGGGAR